MATGIVNSLESLEDLEQILIAAILIVRKGVWSNLFHAIDMVKDAADLAKDLPACLPELRDIDPKEAGILVSRVYAMIEKAAVAMKG